LLALDLTTADADFYTVLAAWTGTTLGSLMEVASDDPGTLRFEVTSGLTYYVQVAETIWYTAEGSFDVSWAFQEPPENDDFANAQSISGASGSVDGDNTAATAEGGEATLRDGMDLPLNTVWYAYAPLANGDLTLEVTAGTLDTILGVFTGDDVADLAFVAMNDDSIPYDHGWSKLTTQVRSDTTYYVRVDGAQGSEAPFTLAWSLVASAANDDFAAAQELTGSSVSGNNTAATVEPSEPLPGDNPLVRTVWYRWTAPRSGSLHLNMTSAAEALENSFMAVYTGDSPGALAQVAYNGGEPGKNGLSELTMDVDGGTAYHIQVGSWQLYSMGTFTLAWDFTGVGDIDTDEPTGTIQLDGGNAKTFLNPVPVDLTASDATSSVVEMRFSNDKTTWSDWQAYAAYVGRLLPADGPNTLYVQFKDEAGNVNSADISDGITLDTTGPSGTVSINGGADYAKSANVTLTISAADTYSSVDEMNLSNDSVNWAGWVDYATSYPWILAGPDGANTVYVKFVDNLANVGTAMASDSIILDTAAPTIQASPTSTDFKPSIDVTLTSPDGTASIYYTTDGVTTPTSAGNSSSVGTQTYTLDDVGPAVTITAPVDGSVTSDDTPTFTYDFGDAELIDVYVDDVLTGTPSGTEVSHLDDGEHTVSVTAFDYWGNETTVTNTFTVDTAGPSVVISSTATSPTGTSPIPVKAEFSEAVTGFTAGDITVAKGSVSNFSGSGDTYTFDVTPNGQGLVTVDVSADVAQDAAGNDNTAATSLTRTYDSVGPEECTIAINGGATYTKSTAVILTLSATDETSGVSQMSFSNDTGIWSDWENYATTKSWTLDSGDGIQCAYVMFRDAAGNVSTGYFGNGITLDTHAPTVALSSTASDPTGTSPIPMTATFSEAVTGFDLTDVTVGNGTVGNLSVSALSIVGASTYTFDVTPSGDGLVTVDVAGDVAQDAAGNGNTAAARVSIYYDGSDPAVSSVSSTLGNGSYRAGRLVPITVTFNEPVYVTIGGGTPTLTLETGTADRQASYDSGTSTDTLTFNYTVQPGDTSADLDYVTSSSLVLNGGTIKDTIGNDADLTLTAPGAAGSLGANKNIVIDTTAPGLTLSSTAADPTSTSPIPVTAIFSEAVTGFTVGDITVGNGSVAVGSLSGGGTTYTFNVTPSGNGVVTVDVAAGVAQDGSGNGNTAATQLSRTYSAGATHFTITASAGAHGTIAPKGTSTVNQGASKTFTITPASGYHIKDVVVDGTTSVKPALVAHGRDGYTYTFNNVQANRTIVASFESDNANFTIQASVSGFGGTIGPSGNVPVHWSRSVTFAVTPYAGFHVDKVLVDGVAVALSGGKYTFTNVTAAHTIAASFAQDVFVEYYWGGFLSPLSNSDITSFNRGTTILVKFRLLNAPPVTDAMAILKVAGPSGFVFDGPAPNAFAYDPIGHSYSYRLRTTSWWRTGIYTLAVTLDDGTSWSIRFRLR
jgi:hypothetical protein